LKFAPVASSTFKPSGTTSLPIPSPGITAILYTFTLALQAGKNYCGASPASATKAGTAPMAEGMAQPAALKN
jgi:hypothetical protein